jgi:hypothetical protein
MPSQVAVIKKNYPQKISTYAILTLVILAGAAYYGYQQYVKLTDAQNAIVAEQEQSGVLQTAADKYEKDYNELKKAFETDFASTLNALEAVYPSAENYTALTKVLDSYFLDKNKSNPGEPIFNSDLKFSRPLIDDGKDYAVLPFSMTVSATKKSFEDFLRYVESSGSLDDKSRLMDIKAISINFPVAQTEGETQIQGANQYSISLSMDSYFRKPSSANAAETAASAA